MNGRIIILLIFLCFALNSYGQIEGVRVTYTRNPDNSCDFYYQKSSPGTYHLIVKFESLKNTDKYFYEGNIKENSGFLFKLKPIKPEKKIKFICEPYFIKGNPKPDIDKNFKYLLPFKKGGNISIWSIMTLMSQLAEGDNNYITPINYSESTQNQTIHVMRKGIVIEIENEYDFDPKSFDIFYEKRNSIIIEHEDGTYAKYAGFKKDAINVKIGQTVLPTEYLGILEKSVDNQYHLFFQIYYKAYMKDVFPDKKKHLDRRITKKLNPFFQTNKGLIALDDKMYKSQDYTVTTPENIIKQELTKKELEERAEFLTKKTAISN
ncbi:peptidoglycan DD-metalloendopeptidase family protein [Flavobacterium sp. ARAG 55.4]|uniref:peptidoglycan DD-metalloendopeptidase family protein n=1 Tax=Flavobacterium sp. ARAG 55.4 TaxID=3451357 RepID=UPI003F470ED4